MRSFSGSDRYSGGANITPSDRNRLSSTSQAIYIGGVDAEGQGQMLVELEDGEVIKLCGLSTGDELSLKAIRIYRTGTTAKDIVALYNEGRRVGNKVDSNSIDFSSDFSYHGNYGTLDIGQCPSITDSYVLTDHPRTMLDENGFVSYQPHNFIVDSEAKVILLRGSRYKLWWTGNPNEDYGHFELFGHGGDFFLSGEIVTDNEGYGEYQFISEDKVIGINISWYGTKVDGSKDDIGLISTTFPTCGKRLGFQERKQPRPRRAYNSATESVNTAGVLIETQSAMNLFPRSNPGRAWSGNIMQTAFRLSAEDVPANPAGRAGAYVLYHSGNNDPAVASGIDRLRCPHPVDCSNNTPTVFSVFIKPMRFNTVDLIIEQNKAQGDDDPSHRLVITFDFNEPESKARYEMTDGSESHSGVLKIIHTTITTLPNNWYRVSVSLVSTCNRGIGIEIRPEWESLLEAMDDFASHGTKTAYFAVWGFQLEKNHYPSSYLPTYGTALQLPGEYLDLDSEWESKSDRLTGLSDGFTFRVDFSLPPYLLSLKDYAPDRPSPYHLIWWWGDDRSRDFGFLCYLSGYGKYLTLWVVHIDDSDQTGERKEGDPPNHTTMSIAVPVEDRKYSLVFTKRGSRLIGFLDRASGAEEQTHNQKWPSHLEVEYNGLRPVDLWKGGIDKYPFRHSVSPASVRILRQSMDYPELLNSF